MLPLSLRWTIGLGLVASACSETSDACISLAEHELLLTAFITDTGTRARTEIELRRAPDELSLGLCEHSTLSVDDVRTTRIRLPDGSSLYTADIAVIGAAPKTRTFTLKHEDGVDTYSAQIEAPAFEISRPQPDTMLSRTTSWELAWTPARPDATISARIDDIIDGEACLGTPVHLELPDSGSALIGPGELSLAEESLPALAHCAAFVHLARRVSAPLEPTAGRASRLHHDSHVEASTSRELPFTSVP